MGQYYRAILLNEDKTEVVNWLSSYEFDNGAKLTEHSCVGNAYVNAACEALKNNKKLPFVWCGDYAETILGYHMENAYVVCYENKDKEIKCEKDIWAYVNAETLRYIINHTKMEYVELKYRRGLHPLPLLTADGNGRGGGDYYSKDEDKMANVGIWAYDIIECSNEKPEGYTKKEYDFGWPDWWTDEETERYKKFVFMHD